MNSPAQIVILGLLLTSAAVKAINLSDDVNVQVAADNAYWLVIATVQVELFVAFLLLSGRLARLAWSSALGLFSVFAAYSLNRALAGYASCGCFGPIEVHPWWTFALDLAVIALLIVRRKDFLQTRTTIFGSLRPWVAATGFAVLGGLSLALMLRSAPTALGDGMAASSDGSVVVLEPAEWVGKTFPLMDEIAAGEKLAAGEWIVVLYHHDCPKCQEALPRYERLAAAGKRDGARVLLVETPPFGDGELGDGMAARARLSAERQWFVQAPVEIRLRDGEVTLASLELPSLDMSGR